MATTRSALPMVAAHAPELMTEPLAETTLGSLGRLALGDLPEAIKGKTLLVIGPGLGRHIETVELVQSVVNSTKLPTVIDADGLNAFEGVADMLSGAGRTLVLTPHPGEMARLAGKTVAQFRPTGWVWRAPSPASAPASWCSRGIAPSSRCRMDAPGSTPPATLAWLPAAPATS